MDPDKELTPRTYQERGILPLEHQRTGKLQGEHSNYHMTERFYQPLFTVTNEHGRDLTRDITRDLTRKAQLPLRPVPRQNRSDTSTRTSVCSSVLYLQGNVFPKRHVSGHGQVI